MKKSGTIVDKEEIYQKSMETQLGIPASRIDLIQKENQQEVGLGSWKASKRLKQNSMISLKRAFRLSFMGHS
ncbi:MAG: hypothetical protein HYR80_04375 [Nitrospirae bacterium]|nr:hypothetical protein [Nitrospirota bacterium]